MSEPLHLGQADPVKVFDLVEHLRKAFDGFFAQSLELQPSEYSKIDIMMAVHNFHKLVIQHLGQDCEEQVRNLLFEISSTTYRMAMDKLRQENHAEPLDHQTS